MADLVVKIDDYVPEFIALLKRGHSHTLILNNTLAAARTISAMYQKVWRRYAMGDMTVPGHKRIQSRGPYARSIQTSEEGTVFTVFTDYPPHKYIEDGHPEIDLKPGLMMGPKARMGKHGPFNIVMFRHGTPGSLESNRPMPLSIYRLMLSESKKADDAKAKGLAARPGTSKVLVSGSDPTQRQYTWGAKLDTAYGIRSQRYSGYTWKAGKYEGMIRMQQSTSKAKRSQYMTFRVVSMASDPRSWIVPPEAGIPIRQATVDFVHQHVPVEQMLRDAVEKDLR